MGRQAARANHIRYFAGCTRVNVQSAVTLAVLTELRAGRWDRSRPKQIFACSWKQRAYLIPNQRRDPKRSSDHLAREGQQYPYPVHRFPADLELLFAASDPAKPAEAEADSLNPAPLVRPNNFVSRLHPLARR